MAGLVDCGWTSGNWREQGTKEDGMASGGGRSDDGRVMGGAEERRETARDMRIKSRGAAEVVFGGFRSRSGDTRPAQQGALPIGLVAAAKMAAPTGLSVQGGTSVRCVGIAANQGGYAGMHVAIMS
jgi:hypothetical protein